ncbi:hypothetical protein DH2020_038880 [Rehmannia glutinosa]|uniref:Ty3 transposon capsid-like protein domain-containing protein n=1 Tax=Rehmannia glutinosa TaxID=99300 RepID=A0ABR0UXC7_REHGL
MARNKGKKKARAEEKVAVLKVGEDKLEGKAGGKAGTKEVFRLSLDMAEGTRMKDLQEAQKRLDQILQTESLKRKATEQKLQDQISGITSEMQEQLPGLNGKFDHLTNTLAAIQLQLLNPHKGKGPTEEESILGGHFSGSGSEGTHFRNNNSPRNRMLADAQGMQVITPIPKVDFPRFDGSFPRSWILKCNGYFKLVPNIPDAQKVILASMHFDGKAAQWFQNFSIKQPELSWQQFIEIISARFEELKEAKIIAEFNKLKHIGSYHDYVEKFEELKACMLLLNNGDFSEEYFITSFISGLSEELQAFVTMFEPVTLQQTIELGRKQLLTLEALTKKIRTPMKPFTNIYPNTRKPDAVPIQNSKPNSMSSPRQPIKLLTTAEMAAMRDKGLCYNCDEKFTFGHRCKQRINYMIMTEDEELAYLQDTPAAEAIYEPPQEQMDEIQMTLNAISGEDGLTTMRLFGQCGEHMLHILIDSGSTLSFIQEATTKRLGCKLTPAKPLLVKVANGQRLVSSQKAEDFTWEMQGNNFAYSLRLLKNKGCDLILGGDWLKARTPLN